MLVRGPALLLASALLPAAAVAGAGVELGRSAAVAADDSCSSSSDAAGLAACAVSALQREATGQRHTGLASTDAGVGGAAGRRASLGRVAQEVLRTQAEKIAVIFNASAALPDDDPLWESAALAVKQAIYNTDPDSKEWMDYCTAGNYESFNAKSCDPECGGSSIMDGVAADAWYCGRTEQMDWGSSGGPVADLCGAEVGSAYKPDGVCGSLSNKQLLYNFVYQGPSQWHMDPTTINVPSVDCLMGIVDCDIYYCHKCAGRCQA